jgi:hypothetical protein
MRVPKRFPRNIGIRPNFTTSELIGQAEGRIRVMQATRDKALLAGTDTSDAHLQAMYAEQLHLAALREKKAAQLPVHLTKRARWQAGR